MEDNIPDFKGIEDLNNIFEEIDEGFYIPNPNTKKETIYSFFSFFLNDTINEDKKNQVILKLKEIFNMNKDLPLIYFKDSVVFPDPFVPIIFVISSSVRFFT